MLEADRREGAEIVDAALAELKKIPRLSHRRRRQTSSVIGSVFRYILKAIPTGPAAAPSQNKQPPKAISGPLLGAVELLQQAVQHNNSDALYILAELNFFGNYSHPRNLRAA